MVNLMILLLAKMFFIFCDLFLFVLPPKTMTVMTCHDKTRNSETDTSVSDQNLESSKMIPNQSCMNLAIFLPN